jgi:hypothetical protein
MAQIQVRTEEVLLLLVASAKRGMSDPAASAVSVRREDYGGGE